MRTRTPTASYRKDMKAMAIRRIVKFGDSVLEKECRKVEKFDKKLHQLLDDMKETLADANGAGLAAPQVGILRSVCVVDVGEGPIELVNPETLHGGRAERSGRDVCPILESTAWSSCPMKVTVRAQVRDGNWFEKTGEALCARAFCHEIDHLHGVLFTSHVSRMLTPEELENGVIEEEE